LACHHTGSLRAAQNAHQRAACEALLMPSPQSLCALSFFFFFVFFFLCLWPSCCGCWWASSTPCILLCTGLRVGALGRWRGPYIEMGVFLLTCGALRLGSPPLVIPAYALVPPPPAPTAPRLFFAPTPHSPSSPASVLAAIRARRHTANGSLRFIHTHTRTCRSARDAPYRPVGLE